MRLGAAAYFSNSVLALATMLALAFTISLDGCLPWLTAAAAGLGAWTFAEYWAHRILYHRVAFFARMHERHHLEPDALIGAPPGLLFALVVILLSAPTYWLAGSTICAGATFGAFAGYLLYTAAHHISHFGKPETDSLFRGLRVWHLRHHHAGVEGNYGVSAPFWDYVFGTAIKRRRERLDQGMTART